MIQERIIVSGELNGLIVSVETDDNVCWGKDRPLGTCKIRGTESLGPCEVHVTLKE